MNYDNYKLETPPQFLEESEEHYISCDLCLESIRVDEIGSLGDYENVCEECIKLEIEKRENNMTIEELQESIERNMPETYGFSIISNKIKGDTSCFISIRREGDTVHQNNSDTLYWALKDVDNYFTGIKK